MILKESGVRLSLISKQTLGCRAQQASLMLSSRSSSSTHAFAAVGLMKSAVLRKFLKAGSLQEEFLCGGPTMMPHINVFMDMLRTRGNCFPNITTEALSAGHLNT